MAKTKQSLSADSETFLTKQELARILKVTPRTLEQWAKQKRFPVYRLGRVVRYKREEVTQALAAYRVEAKHQNKVMTIHEGVGLIIAVTNCCWRLVEVIVTWM